MHKRTYNGAGSYEWDPRKAKSNLIKHGIDFAEAVAVLEDEQAISISDIHPEEERMITIGKDGFSRILVVVWTLRGKGIRIISARKATFKERNQYESRNEKRV